MYILYIYIQRKVWLGLIDWSGQSGHPCHIASQSLCCLLPVFRFLCVCVFSRQYVNMYNGIADSEVRLHQAATAGLQQHQDLK